MFGKIHQYYLVQHLCFEEVSYSCRFSHKREQLIRFVLKNPIKHPKTATQIYLTHGFDKSSIRIKY